MPTPDDEGCAMGVLVALPFGLLFWSVVVGIATLLF